MLKNLNITIISEDSVFEERLMAEHGLSILLEYKNHKYLFDTGQGLTIAHNSKNLGLEFNSLDGIFISHDHLDHTGGLNEVLAIKKDIPVYAHPEILKNHPVIKNKVPIKKPFEIIDGLWLTGEIAPEINWGGGKYGRAAATENALFVETDQGLVVLVGCSHPGIIRILEKIKSIAQGKRLRTVIGGMHLLHKDEVELKQIVNELEKLGVEMIFPMHCTGFQAKRLLANRFGDKMKILRTGNSIEL